MSMLMSMLMSLWWTDSWVWGDACRCLIGFVMLPFCFGRLTCVGLVGHAVFFALILDFDDWYSVWSSDFLSQDRLCFVRMCGDGLDVSSLVMMLI